MLLVCICLLRSLSWEAAGSEQVTTRRVWNHVNEEELEGLEVKRETKVSLSHITRMRNGLETQPDGLVPLARLQRV